MRLCSFLICVRPAVHFCVRSLQQIMRTYLFSLFLLAISSAVHATAGDEIRSFKNENIGKVTLSAPKDWAPIERHHINFGTTFYRFVPPQKGQFDFEIMVNDLAHMRMEALVDKDLEIYIQSNMAGAKSQSTEGKVTAVRFGSKKDGVYARLTDKAPKAGEFVLFTQGVRLQGKKVVLFTLYSNDKDGSILRKALEIVDSIQFQQ
jgi:hypothetical protein